MSILQKVNYILICIFLVCCITPPQKTNPPVENQSENSQTGSKEADLQKADPKENTNSNSQKTAAARNTLLKDTAGLQNIKVSTPKSTLPFDTLKITLSPVTPQPIENKSFHIAQVRKVKKEKKVETPKEKKVVKEQPSYKKISNIPKTVQENVTLLSGEYYLDHSLTIAKGFTLQIEPGTKIEMDAAGIVCNGKLVAIGNKKQPIVFYGEAWDNIAVFGDGSEVTMKHCRVTGGSGVGVQRNGNDFTITPQNLDITYGGGLLIANKCKASLENCEIKNVYGLNMLAVLSSEAQFVACKFIGHSQQGFYVNNGTIKIKNCLLEQHDEIAIKLEGFNSLTVENNTFSNCGIAISKSTGTVGSIRENKYSSCQQEVVNN